MTDVILDVSHIAKTFGHVQALKDITLSLRKGRVHTLLGENGAGKFDINENTGRCLSANPGNDNTTW
ncbi:hypothetical protein EIMP300_18570 [Escherichia coli]|uniref:Uncharacterized protein n=1 Tax=Escherichia coli TaxID=562 RepID=A0A8S0FJQ0_ECOLX|nr:hypothetical protein EIMP300_18570 [Escherichia coli]